MVTLDSKIYTLILIRSLNQRLNFRLTPYLEEAEDYDLIFFNDGDEETSIRCYKINHTNENNPQITETALNSSSKTENYAFWKNYISFCKMQKSNTFKDKKNLQLIILTNSSISSDCEKYLEVAELDNFLPLKENMFYKCRPNARGSIKDAIQRCIKEQEQQELRNYAQDHNFDENADRFIEKLLFIPNFYNELQLDELIWKDLIILVDNNFMKLCPNYFKKHVLKEIVPLPWVCPMFISEEGGNEIIKKLKKFVENCIFLTVNKTKLINFIENFENTEN